MKILNRNTKKGILKLQTQTLDDVWILSKVIEVGDSVSGDTQRKLKLGESTDRNQAVIRKWMFLEIVAQKVEYEPEFKQLRVTGPIAVGNDDVAKGDFHSFTITDETIITITKKWHQYQIAKLEQKQQSSIIVMCDRDYATIGTLSQQGYQQLTQLHGEVTKKDERAQKGEDFFLKLATYLNELKPSNLIIACSHFWQARLKELLSVPVTFIDQTSMGNEGIRELITTPEFNRALKDNVFAKQVELCEQVLKEIATTQKATYGFNHSLAAAKAGAVSEILISNKSLHTAKEKDTYHLVEELIESVELGSGNVHIVDEENPIANTIDGLGGFVCMLRYVFE